MTRVRIRFRLVDGVREAEVSGYRLRIAPQLGPEEMPVAARELGHGIVVLHHHAKGANVVWEDWQPTVHDAVEAGARYIAERLHAKLLGVSA